MSMRGKLAAMVKLERLLLPLTKTNISYSTRITHCKTWTVTATTMSLAATNSWPKGKRSAALKAKCVPLRTLPTIDETKVTSDLDTSFDNFQDSASDVALEDIKMQEMEEGNVNAAPHDDSELVKGPMCTRRTCSVAWSATAALLVLSFILGAILWASFTDAQLPLQ